MDLDLAHVRSLLAVVDYGGYHRAAEALHLSQPAVSQHVRRLEAQLGGPLFDRRGRGVEVSARGDSVVGELRGIVEAHDSALARLSRGAAADGPFVLGSIEHLVDPVLPELISALRARLDERPVRLRVDRSQPLVERLQAGDVDAAIVMDPATARDPVELGAVPLHWWAGGELAARPLPEPVPVVAYDPPCGLRDLALGRLAQLGLATTITAESPHLTGIHAAVRSGLGIALLAGGADGLRRIEDGELAEALTARLWLVVADAHRGLVEPLRSALWAATARANAPRRRARAA